jgi:tetratricopeptide (TPR) repeat protein
VKALPFLLLGFRLFGAYAQHDSTDIFDEVHSRVYARHLFDSKRFDEAAGEYSRLIKIADDDSLKIMFLKSNRLTSQPAERIEAVKTLIIDPNDSLIWLELEKYYLTAGTYGEAYKQMSHLDENNRTKFLLQTMILEKHWKGASNFLVHKMNHFPDANDSQYYKLIMRGFDLRYRSPALAATMSAIVPGSGKMYAGEWKDGLVVFFFTVFSAYEAAHSFQVAGQRSVMGWIYTGLAAGFYTGNIYGSYKSANRFNARQEETVIEDAKAIIFSTY